ncbi:unnamed protein product [Cuscuta europaea]|uniref:Uncharacterized protein n=1 Tax=Cuscuta europaea TaxID=41803 RepID=A0A9P1DWP0_CUSEU|nr:unnamed protein product [Cuscuta europaea]
MGLVAQMAKFVLNFCFVPEVCWQELETPRSSQELLPILACLTVTLFCICLGNNNNHNFPVVHCVHKIHKSLIARRMLCTFDGTFDEQIHKTREQQTNEYN